MNNVTQRFLHYVSIDTQSNNTNHQLPSSKGQWDLAYILADELKNLGLINVIVTDNCFVHGTLPANTTIATPCIGLVAYLDTSSRFNSININPRIHHDYKGGSIPLDTSGDIVLSPDKFPELNNYIGHDLITTDGTSLLGSNGKAGIAEIMTTLEKLIKNPNIAHGDIRVVFTPDQETTSRGIKHIDLALFDVNFAITLDGDAMGEINFENFNAANAILQVNGCSAFTGDAKNKMVNAGRIAAEWVNYLPHQEIPEETSDYEGFFHIGEISGLVESAEVHCMIRDFESEGFMHRKVLLHKITKTINDKYGKGTATLTIQDEYYNMKNILASKPQLISLITNAVADSGLIPKIAPIRGGSDGALLASMGIPAPNLFSGGHNCHGPYEFISIQSMEKAVDALLQIIRSACHLENY